LAKIAGIKLVEAYRRQYGRDYIAVMPANLYGLGDNFDPVSGHVLPALIHKAHVAKLGGEKSLTIWGSGTPRREFLHVDDCADALVFLLKHYSEVATGHSRSRLGRASLRNRGLSRRHRPRSRQARWHPPQADELRPVAQNGLDTKHCPEGWDRQHLSMAPAE
jgi:nucleoside-diphosphate-sugar epimerase